MKPNPTNTTSSAADISLASSSASRLSPTAVRLLGAVGFALATALAAQITIPLPYTPVPITLQTVPVLVAGAALGGRFGMLSMLLYVALGAAGLPVFADACGGVHVLIGATAGYLVGFVLAQPVISAVFSARLPGGRAARALAAVLAGKAVIFACGLIWLHYWSGWTWSATLAAGLLPFLVGAVAKTALAAGVSAALPAGRR
jgi:biotin transport system substrate-specific component